MLICPACAHNLYVPDDTELCPRCAWPLQDAKEIPVLQPITVRPVELNEKLWAEWKRIADGIES